VPEWHVTGDAASILPKFRQSAAMQLQNSKLKSQNLFQLPNFFPVETFPSSSSTFPDFPNPLQLAFSLSLPEGKNNRAWESSEM
jgi:hypothetical protein